MKRQILLCFACLATICFCSGCAELAPENSIGEFDVYFCDLIDCSEVFESYVNSSASIRCAFYDLDDASLESALANKGASIVLDEDAHAVFGARKRFGEGLMHHKFCVINDSTVVTGSFNPVQSSSDDFNNVLVIGSPPLASLLLSVHEYLGAGHGGEQEVLLSHNGARLQVLSCPQAACKETLLARLGSAQTSVEFALFTFTDSDVADVLLEKHYAGVEVSGVVESFQSSQWNQALRLQEEGIDVMLEQSNRLQHNKVFVIDGQTVITGSYNPTLAADTINDELLIIIDDVRVAKAYAATVSRIRQVTQNFK